MGSGLARLITRGRRGTSVDVASASALVAAAGVALAGLVVHWRWQTDVRRLMGMEPSTAGYMIGVVVATLVVAALLMLGARGVRSLLGFFRRLLRRRFSPRIATTGQILLIIVTTILFLDLVVAGQAIPALEEAHHRSDTSFDPNIAPPDSAARSGGPGSLIEWETMGRQGREFVAGGPSLAELEAFSGEEPFEPIRIYVGLQPADSAQSRANLALAEMERSGAFDRETIVLVVPTGSGWIDPYAVSPLEYMYNGDTAAVAVQYSFLASWLVMVRNQDLATDAARALFQVVSRRLAEGPEETRPRLLLYGESLGAFGWERTFSDLARVTAGADGVLWVGPPRVNPLWRRIVAARDPDSPIWRPVYDHGVTVRFGPDAESWRAPEGRWRRPRIIYLQHASDPITWLSADLAFRRPEWLASPRGPDVSEHTPYLPVVTYLQMTIDLVLGTNAPLGHGHKFGEAQAEAWSMILPPPGWGDLDTEALLARLDR